jgi:hypothetical protein
MGICCLIESRDHCDVKQNPCLPSYQHQSTDVDVHAPVIVVDTTVTSGLGEATTALLDGVFCPWTI